MDDTKEREEATLPLSSASVTLACASGEGAGAERGPHEPWAAAHATASQRMMYYDDC
jgi:hypothetical protein